MFDKMPLTIYYTKQETWPVSCNARKFENINLNKLKIGDYIMNIYKSAGMVTGIILGIIICIIAFKFLNKDKKVKTQYDERQLLVRGKAYQIGFYTMSVYFALLFLLEMSEITVPIAQSILYFTGFIAGGAALCIYCIWNGAYFGLNNKAKSWMIFLGVFAIINGIYAWVAFSEGRMIVNGVLEYPFVNILCDVLLIIAIVTYLIKHFVDGNKEDLDDEES